MIVPMTSDRRALGIRTLQAEDLDAIAAIEATTLSPWSFASLAGELEVSNGIRLVAEGADGRCCGWCCCRVVAPEAELLKIAVLQGRRRSGIGRKLLGELLIRLQKMGCRELFLEVRAGNTTARRFYCRQGFSETGLRRKYYQDPVEDCLLMKLQLDSLA